MSDQAERGRARLPFSCFIIARNEADRIGAALAAVRELADEILVVDSGSEDDTASLSERAGARVLHRAFDGYGPQKRWAEEQCRHDWLLNLDADEIVSDELARALRAVFERPGGPDRDAYRIGIAEVFPGETRPHRLAYRLDPVRLYRRSRGRYSRSPVHDRVELEPGATVGSLPGLLHHFSVRSLGDQVAKLNRYSDQQADDLADRGVSLPTWRVFVEFPAAFLKAYLGRRHAIRGTYGFLTAMNYAIARHLRMAKHYERRRGAHAPESGLPPPEPTAPRPGDG